MDRLVAMADALSTHIGKLGRSRCSSNPQNSGDILPTATNMTRNRLLEGIHIYRVHDQSELLVDTIYSFFKIMQIFW